VYEIRETQEGFMTYYFAVACSASVYMIMNASQFVFRSSKQVMGERIPGSLNMASDPADGISSVVRMVVDPFPNTPLATASILGMDLVLEPYQSSKNGRYLKMLQDRFQTMNT
jgi:hypothetical protein